MIMNASAFVCCLLLCSGVDQIDGDPADILDNLKSIIGTAKAAKNIWEVVKAFPPTLADYLINGGSQPDRDESAARASYDFVVDLTQPSDIYNKLKSYSLVFPMGRETYDRKVEEDGHTSRFIVNVVGRYNVGKTYVLRLLANINLGHTFVERTNGVSVSLPSLNQTDETPMALIDTAGTRTPVEYHDDKFKDRAYERQVSDSFIQEVALNSAEIFLCVVNQMTLDDQLYLRTLYKRLQDRGLKENDIKQRLLVVHNYFNLRTVAEVEETEKSELINLFNAKRQPQGHWLSEHFKHFVLVDEDSEAGKIYNRRSIEQIRTMIKGANAANHTNVLDAILEQIEILLNRVLVEVKSSKAEQDSNDEAAAGLASRLVGLLSRPIIARVASSTQGTRLNLAHKNHVNVKLEVKELPMEMNQSLWFICSRETLGDNIELSRNLKFADDGSVNVDFSSQFIPNMMIRQMSNGNIEIAIECPTCYETYNVTVRGTSIYIQGEKAISDADGSRNMLNTRLVGKFDIEVPVGKMETSHAYDFRKDALKTSYENGVITIIVEVLSDEF